MSWQVNPDFAVALPRLLETPAELIKQTPLKRVHRHRLDGHCFYVKRSFHHQSMRHFLGDAWRRPRNRVDWILGQKLQSRGIAVVPFVAYGERRSWRGLHETALVSLAPKGYVTLQEVADINPQIQGTLGRFLSDLHDAGVALRDLHTKNLLYSPLANAFCLFDLDTVTIKARVGMALRVNHLARLHYRMPLSPAFYTAYNQSVRIDPDMVARLAPLQRRSRCLKINRDFDRLRLGNLRWWARRNALTPALLRVLSAPDLFLEGEARILKQEPHSIVGIGHGMVVKCTRARGPVNLLKGWFRRAPALRTYRKAYHLELAGIPSARPIAASAQRTLGLPIRSYFAMEAIPGATPFNAWRGKWRVTIRDLAELIGRLHRAGFVHRDLKETNIVFDTSGCPRLLDLDGLRFLGTVPDRRAAGDLARLLRGAARSFALARSDLARFLAYYCEARGGLAWREWWKRLGQNRDVVRVLASCPPRHPISQERNTAHQFHGPKPWHSQLSSSQAPVREQHD